MVPTNTADTNARDALLESASNMLINIQFNTTIQSRHTGHQIQTYLDTISSQFTDTSGPFADASGQLLLSDACNWEKPGDLSDRLIAIYKKCKDLDSSLANVPLQLFMPMPMPVSIGGYKPMFSAYDASLSLKNRVLPQDISGSSIISVDVVAEESKPWESYRGGWRVWKQFDTQTPPTSNGYYGAGETEHCTFSELQQELVLKLQKLTDDNNEASAKQGTYFLISPPSHNDNAVPAAFWDTTKTILNAEDFSANVIFETDNTKASQYQSAVADGSTNLLGITIDTACVKLTLKGSAKGMIYNNLLPHTDITAPAGGHPTYNIPIFDFLLHDTKNSVDIGAYAVGNGLSTRYNKAFGASFDLAKDNGNFIFTQSEPVCWGYNREHNALSNNNIAVGTLYGLRIKLNLFQTEPTDGKNVNYTTIGKKFPALDFAFHDHVTNPHSTEAIYDASLSTFKMRMRAPADWLQRISDGNSDLVHTVDPTDNITKRYTLEQRNDIKYFNIFFCDGNSITKKSDATSPVNGVTVDSSAGNYKLGQKLIDFSEDNVYVFRAIINTGEGEHNNGRLSDLRYYTNYGKTATKQLLTGLKKTPINGVKTDLSFGLVTDPSFSAWEDMSGADWLDISASDPRKDKFYAADWSSQSNTNKLTDTDEALPYYEISISKENL